MAVPGGPLGSDDAVQVLTVHRVRARRFQAVLVLGLVEGEFPGRGDRPALLTAAQRAHLDAIGGGLFPPEADEEEALFARAVSRAWRVLLLSARDADDGGGYAGQSYYWSHCKSASGGRRTTMLVHRTLADQVFELAERSFAAAVSAGLRRHGLEPHRLLRPAAHSRPPDWGRQTASRGSCSPQVLEELAATGCFTPSALESYLRCPFAWFVERVIGADEHGDARRTTVWRANCCTACCATRSANSSQRSSCRLRAQHLAYGRTDGGRPSSRPAVQSDECPGTQAERRVVASGALKRMAADRSWRWKWRPDSPLSMAETELPWAEPGGVDIGGLA